MFEVVLCIFLILFVIFVIVDIKKPNNYPPGPSWLPLVGSLLSFQQLRRQLGYYYLACHALSQKYGPLVGLRLGRDLVILVTNADVIQEVLNREEFSGRPNGFFFRMRTFGKNLGLVFNEGPLWQEQRRFSLHQLKQLGFGRREMEEQICSEAQLLVDSLKGKQGQPVQVHNLFHVSVINVLWLMVAGERFHFDDYRLKELLDIIHEQFRASDISGGLLNQLPFLRYIAPGWSGYTQHLHTLQRMWGFLSASVEEHRSSLSENSTPRDLIEAFLQRASKSVKNEEEGYTDEQLLSMCMDLFMAGSETTTNTLEFLLLFMVRYPKVQKKLQEELDSVLGGDRTATLRDRPKLPYATAVLNEVQRCAHVVPLGLGRRCKTSTTLFGYNIPSNAVLVVDLHALHTDPKAWSDPQEFRPERFLQIDDKLFDVHFAPFGNGRRRCLGESLAKANMFLLMTTLFHSFTVSIPANCPEPSFRPVDGFTLAPEPFQVVFTPRF